MLAGHVPKYLQAEKKLKNLDLNRVGFAEDITLKMNKINLFLFIFYFVFTSACFAKEECDYKFYEGIPVKAKVVGKLPFGEDLMDIYIVDRSGNLLTGTICQYNGSILVLKEYVINGKPEGLGEAWYKNGNKRWESEFKNGIVNGRSKYFFEDGTPNMIFQSINGKMISAECANGYKWSESEISKWNYGGEARNSVRNICKNK